MSKKKPNYSIYTIVGILLVPASLSWILYRYGLSSIVDALAVGILAGFGLLMGIKYIISKKIIKFG